MATTTPSANLPVAQPGDTLTGDDLAVQIKWLQDQATALNQDKKPGMPDDQLRDIATQQEALRDQADDLLAVRIGWVAGQAKLEAQHIQDALDYAQKVIDKVAALKKKLRILAAVVSFFGVALTGNPLKTIKAGAQLKKDIDAAGKDKT